MEKKKTSSIKSTKNTAKKIIAKKRTTTRKKKAKGFTLIELLAVIIILGILLIIAIPSVTTYISNSRKSSYIDTVRTIIGAARNFTNDGKQEMYDEEATYYIPISCLHSENGTKTPYGKFSTAYVLVTYTGEGFDYYFTGTDTSKTGIKDVVSYNNLKEDDIESGISDVDIRNNVGIDGRKYAVIYNSDCSEVETKIKAGYQYYSEDGEIIESDPLEYPDGKDRDTVDIGDIVVISQEEFYVIKKDENNLTLLARYNLNVGSNKNTNVTEGIQHSSVKGWLESGTKYGNVGFLSRIYWQNNVGEGLTYPGSFNSTNYPYVYDSNCVFYRYIEAYKEYLISLKIHVKEARVMSYQEMRELGCSSSNCNNAPAFMYEVSYWLGSATTESGYVWHIYSNGKVDGYNSYPFVDGLGVRPVIVV